MSELFDALPGAPMRVAEVAPALARYWQEAGETGTTTRAAQMNLVLILGQDLAPDSAAGALETAYALSRRYPCRIVVLCPVATPGADMRGRLDLVCHVSPDGATRRCGEALMLGFPPETDAAMIDSQVSVWTESDLPVHVWLHAVDAGELPRYAPLMRAARRVVYDSTLAGDAARDYGPRADAVRDLAHARLLAVRQALGQFLSAYSPAELVRGLDSVVVRHAPSRSGEARRLVEWMRARLESCATRADRVLVAVFRTELVTDCDACLSTDWSYANGDSFRWNHAPTGSGARLAAHIAGRDYEHPLRVPFPEAPAALAEALFF